MSTKAALAKRKKVALKSIEGLPLGLQNAIAIWADATTAADSKRRADLLRDKTKAVADFFAFTGKDPGRVTPLDIKTWQAELEGRGLAPTTVYALISRISSFYNWALEDPQLAEAVHGNPVKLARPKAPKAYQTESTQALSDEETRALLAIVKAKAASGDVVGKRDLALLRFYLATGMRRNEVISLRWGDVKIDGILTLTGKIKGGDYQAREVTDPRVKEALLEYLASSGRLETIEPESPLWISHDQANTRPGKALTSHAFAKNLKDYAKEAGLGDVHLHQLRHTFARLVGDLSGSMVETQHALGHKHEKTTRVYLQRIAVKKDKFSTAVLDRLEA